MPGRLGKLLSGGFKCDCLIVGLDLGTGAGVVDEGMGLWSSFMENDKALYLEGLGHLDLVFLNRCLWRR